MSSSFKVTAIREFINKNDDNNYIIDLDILKKKFILDNRGEGFYKLSLSTKQIIGTQSLNINYNRPPNKIPPGLFCSYCENEGIHKESCEEPSDESLYLTLKGYAIYILNSKEYNGDFKEFGYTGIPTVESITKIITDDYENPSTQSIVSESTFSNGKVSFSEKHESILTLISYKNINKKRGPAKLVFKTATTHFLNSIIIFYEKYNNKTSVRISKNGLINLININHDKQKSNELINELMIRINSSNSVIEKYRPYTKIENQSYIHSASGQFQITSIDRELYEINFNNLDKLIHPTDSFGNLIKRNGITTIGKHGETDIIFLDDIKIIEWQYSLGKLSRNETMSKEYIKFVTIADNGLKISVVINKFGAALLNISRCGIKQIYSGICGNGETAIINTDMFGNIARAINKLFDNMFQDLVIKTLSVKYESAISNIASGYAPSGPGFRSTRTRGGDGVGNTYKESMRPVPYSWKGSCPDPNYQYIHPGGLKNTDGLWYPTCLTKNNESVKNMKNYLKTGFPNSIEEGIKYGITQDNKKDNIDTNSGILIPGSNSPKSNAYVTINGEIKYVTVIKKLTKKSNNYIVKTEDEKTHVVNGKDFKRDSRIFNGLDSLNEEELKRCIIQNLIRSNLSITSTGEIIKNEISELNEKLDNENKNIFINNSYIDKISHLTHYNISKFITDTFTLRKVDPDGNRFYLVLSPLNNFYIRDNLLSTDSYITQKFNDIIILDGYLSVNNEFQTRKYEITDIIHYNGVDMRKKKFEERYIAIYDLSSLLSSAVEEELIITDIYDNVIDGSYKIIDNNSKNKLIFISDNKNIIYGEPDNYPDIIVLQIFSIDNLTINFGYDNKNIPTNMKLDILKNYTFTKSVDDEFNLIAGNYYNIKINRDTYGKIVPNRKITIIGQEINYNVKTKTYDDVIDMLLVKFNPINNSFFASNTSWTYNNIELAYNGWTLQEL